MIDRVSEDQRRSRFHLLAVGLYAPIACLLPDTPVHSIRKNREDRSEPSPGRLQDYMKPERQESCDPSIYSAFSDASPDKLKPGPKTAFLLPANRKSPNQIDASAFAADKS